MLLRATIKLRNCSVNAGVLCAFVLMLLMGCLSSPSIHAQDSQKKSESGRYGNVVVVTSNSIYHFATVVAEIFGKTTQFRSPIVEPVGTGMGFKQFCQKSTSHESDVIFSSRMMHESERSLCQKNGVGEIEEVLIGYDGIVLAVNKKNPLKGVSYDHLFMAMAKNLPLETDNNVWKDNENHSWGDISPSLPDLQITIYGPSSNTNTSDILTELVLVDQCMHICCSEDTYAQRDEYCRNFRDDKHYVVGHDDGRLVIRKLMTNNNAIGILSYGTYLANRDFVNVLEIDGVLPTKEAILAGRYTMTRPIYIYHKVSRLDDVTGLKEFVKFFNDPAIVGENGALAKIGLIPVTAKK